MGPLENQRHELFCQAIAKGETTSKAYQIAGFRASRSNAARLRADERVQLRVQELQQASADGCQITVQSICEELDQAIAIAKSKNQAQPLVNAAALRAKLAGLGIERQAIEVAHSDSRHDDPSPEVILMRMAEVLSAGLVRQIANELGLADEAETALAAGNGPTNGNGHQLLVEWAPPKKAPKREV
jgi:hypothetical protein